MPGSKIRLTFLVATLVAGRAVPTSAQAERLLPARTIAALADELSGETAKRNLEYLARLHRMAGSPAFHEAIAFLAEKAKAAGLSDIRVDSFPADGKRFYGTQRSRPAWWAEQGELWELASEGGAWRPVTRIADWDAVPVSLANLSESGAVEAELVDVGNGTSPADYAGKDVRGKLILAAQQPSAVTPLGIARFGAAGVVSYAQNQRTAWWGEDENLVRWGHFDAFSPANTFGFMVSLKQARALRERLARGETIRLKATVRAGRRPGYYEVLTGVIPGADPAVREQEIAFSCHLDHQRPGANDNASGCATIMEVARALSRLIGSGAIPRPRRTIRFIWPPEIEGTLALLTSKPDAARRIKAVVHMDMVGAGPVSKAVFRVHRGPASLPSFVYDVGHAWAAFVNNQTLAYASTGNATYPLVAREGGKEPFAAVLDDFSLGSDHEVYTESSFAIPAIYLAQWPDRYIHTNFDQAANIDPTVVKRAAFIGAASALVLANAGPAEAPALWDVIATRSAARASAMLERRADLPPAEQGVLARAHWVGERALVPSLASWAPLPDALVASANAFINGLEVATGKVPAAPAASGLGASVYSRNRDVKGPTSAFAYDYFAGHYGAGKAAALRLRSYVGRWGAGGDYAYEILNFVDGIRSAQEVRDRLSAEYGPIPLDVVLEYLEALAAIGLVRKS